MEKGREERETKETISWKTKMGYEERGEREGETVERK